MILHLPLPCSTAERRLNPLHLGALAAIRRNAPIHHGGEELLERLTGLSSDPARDVLDVLAIRSLVMVHRHDDGRYSVACPRLVRDNFRAEKDRNRKRARRGKPQEWPFCEMIRRHFPSACPHPVRDDFRPSSYLVPSVFEPLLKKFPHSHLKQRPVNGEVIAGPYLPGDFKMLVRILEEKMGMGFKLHLLYTRKSVSVARLH
jgi:hypothetical protein